MNISAIYLGTSHGDPSLTRFCSSTFYRFGDITFLIDAAEPVATLLLRQNPQYILNLDAVFFTHMHMDHTGGLPDLGRYLLKYKEDFSTPEIYLPEASAIPIFLNFMKSCHVMGNPDDLNYKSFDQTLIWKRPGFQLTCIPTAHIQNGLFPSYAFLMETEDFRMIHTGDLAADFHDFPLKPGDTPCDICVCEATHIACNLDIFKDKLSKAPIRKLILNHIGPLWTDGREDDLRQLLKDLPFPIVIAYDGMKINLHQ